MTTPSDRRRSRVLGVVAAAPLMLMAAGATPAFANPDMGPPAPAPAPAPVQSEPYGPSVSDPYGPSVLDPFGPTAFDPYGPSGFNPYAADPGPDLGIAGTDFGTGSLIFPWFIWQNPGLDSFTLAKDPPGMGWMLFSGPYETFVEGGADMNLLGVPGWEAF